MWYNQSICEEQKCFLIQYLIQNILFLAFNSNIYICIYIQHVMAAQMIKNSLIGYQYPYSLLQYFLNQDDIKILLKN